MVDITLNDLYAKVKVTHFGTNLFLIFDFMYAANSSFCSKTHHTIRYDTIEEFNVDSKAEYSALSSTRTQKKKLKQTTPVPL